jgi:hypothetical protein
MSECFSFIPEVPPICTVDGLETIPLLSHPGSAPVHSRQPSHPSAWRLSDHGKNGRLPA